MLYEVITGLAGLGAGLRELVSSGVKSRFVGYDCKSHQTTLVAIINESGEIVDQAVRNALGSRPGHLLVGPDRFVFY